MTHLTHFLLEGPTCVRAGEEPVCSRVRAREGVLYGKVRQVPQCVRVEIGGKCTAWLKRKESARWGMGDGPRLG